VKQPASHAFHHSPASFWRLWGWPLVMGVLTTVGLISALFSDGGLGDMVAWVALGIPVVALAWLGWRRMPGDDRVGRGDRA
jgi:hypothetical protein